MERLSTMTFHAYPIQYFICIVCTKLVFGRNMAADSKCVAHGDKLKKRERLFNFIALALLGLNVYIATVYILDFHVSIFDGVVRMIYILVNGFCFGYTVSTLPQRFMKAIIDKT